MIFKATKEQMYRLVKLVVDNSKSEGLGKLYYQDHVVIDREWFDEFIVRKHPAIDYYQGRMVKLYISRFGDITESGDASYEIRDTIRVDYQSWKHKFPTIKHLLIAVGVV